MSDPERYWIVMERTYDPNREIGGIRATRTEWERRVDFDPLSDLDHLAAEVEWLRAVVDAVEDDLGSDYLAALTQEDDRD
jgi:hypothetical protein